jgi:hypothetical protein
MRAAVFECRSLKGITSRPGFSTSLNAFMSMQFTLNAFGLIVVGVIICLYYPWVDPASDRSCSYS